MSDAQTLNTTNVNTTKAFLTTSCDLSPSPSLLSDIGAFASPYALVDSPYRTHLNDGWQDDSDVGRRRTRGLKYPFMVKRLACMVISKSTASDGLDILQPASLLPETVSQMEEEFGLLKETFMKAQIEDEQMTFLTKEWYINILARIRINAFRVELVARSYDDLLASAAASVEAEAAVGNAIYMLPSFYNHDCDPNTHIIWIDNAEARLKALRDIEAGEELRICYVDASMDVEARQSILTQGYGFRCQCLRCSSGD
ncbi:uncharacterized protein A4U43_C08F9270 [Asparagus officinalis]|nr:uncharacterized protein A4U43_C08F9270 [Asparagus officinalis]